MSLLEDNNILVNDGVIAQIMINRPEFLNALNADLFQGIILAFHKVQLRSDLRVVTLWGQGDEAFSAGVTPPTQLGKRAMADYLELGYRAMRTVESCPVPVIAAVNGYGFGAGLEFALSADIIVASTTAKLGFPEVSLGMVPAFGGVERLIERVGIGNAKKLLYSGDLISAEDALRIGLVDEVANAGELNEAVNALADKISKQAPLALQLLKRNMNSSEQFYTVSRKIIEETLALSTSADWEEGVTAFLEKREAKFTGR